MTADNTGAAMALERLSAWEASAAGKLKVAQQALDTALENQRNPAHDGEDFEDAIRQARNQRDDCIDVWKNALNLLQKFDKSVSPERRDTSERISKAEGVKLIEMFLIYFRVGTEGLITQLCPAILECAQPVQVHKLVADKLRECMVGSVESGIRESHLPEWVSEAAQEVLK